ncbi:MAG: 4a-hydroxytetrahydrobiopterin dehydratase [Mariprofundaceae bacterium]
MALQEKACVPCQGGVPPLTAEAARALLAEVPGWELIDDAKKLRRTFIFRNFVAAQEFASKAGAVSESENHHPDITFGWGYCTIVYFTHKIGGLHENDFIMAAKVNALSDS